MTEFPYGADPTNPNSFLGLSNALSRRWFVSYSGGLNVGLGLGAGYHTFIFLGLENLVISVVSMRGGGTVVGAGASRVGRTRRQKIIIDSVEKVNNYYDAARDYLDLDREAQAAVSLYRTMMNDTVPTLVTAQIPFSLNDIGAAWATLEGYNADVYVAGAQVYWLTMHNRVSYFGSDRKYFYEKRLANLDGGAIGVAYAKIFGKLDVGETHSLYDAFGRSSDPNERPYRRIPSVHPYISELPPASSDGEVPPGALRTIRNLNVAQ
jgi:hypothetical protein